jgi:hypothetical protein
MYFHVLGPIFNGAEANWVSVIYLHSLHKMTAKMPVYFLSNFWVADERASLLGHSAPEFPSCIQMFQTGAKEGILLELGFDTVTPNRLCDISSWAYDFAAGKVEIIDNQANGVACYLPGYTLVEKLQAISTKFRKQQEDGSFPVNFMRHYYDVWALLKSPDVQAFAGTTAYQEHKQERFRGKDNPNITENEAFKLTDKDVRALYEAAYQKTSALYYRGRPAFNDTLALIGEWAPKL